MLTHDRFCVCAPGGLPGKSAAHRKLLRALRALSQACDPTSPNVPLFARRVGLLFDAPLDGSRRAPSSARNRPTGLGFVNRGELMKPGRRCASSVRECCWSVPRSSACRKQPFVVMLAQGRLLSDTQHLRTQEATPTTWVRRLAPVPGSSVSTQRRHTVGTRGTP